MYTQSKLRAASIIALHSAGQAKKYMSNADIYNISTYPQPACLNGLERLPLESDNQSAKIFVMVCIAYLCKTAHKFFPNSGQELAEFRLKLPVVLRSKGITMY